MFCLLLISGNPFVGNVQFDLFLISFSLISIIRALRNYNKHVSYRTLIIIIFFMGYELMHSVMFKLDYSLTIIKLFLVLMLGLAIVGILKDRFLIVLRRTMVIISLISFVFVTLSYIPGINKFLFQLAGNIFPVRMNWDGSSTPTLLIYTFHPQYFEGSFSYVRNAGIFWESGAFAVFLNLTLFFHYSTKRIRLFKDLFDKDSIILIIALISTTSTMGLIAFMILLTFFSSQLKTAVKYIVIVLAAASFYFAFYSVEFLGEKINKQLSKSTTSNNRFGSALMDLEDISERPLLGWSRRIEVVFGTSEFSAKTHRPNGITNFLRNYGLVYCTVYFFLVFQSFNRIYLYHHKVGNLIFPAFGVFLLIVVSFSEPIFDLTFFKSLIFLYSVYLPIHQSEKLSKKSNYFLSPKPSSFIKSPAS